MRYTIIGKINKKNFNTKYHHRHRSLKGRVCLNDEILEHGTLIRKKNIPVENLCSLNETFEEMQITESENIEEDGEDMQGEDKNDSNLNNSFSISGDTQELFVTNNEILDETNIEEKY